MNLIKTNHHQRMLGKSGIPVSEIGVGCWAIGGPAWNLGLEMGWGQVNGKEVITAIQSAVLDQGANHFDTADVYGLGKSERLIGTALSGIPRSEYVLGTKVGYFAGTSIHAFHPQAIRNQLETSLTNLKTDYIDIYYMHNFDFGPDNRYLTEAIECFHKFKQEGKIRAIGMRGPHRHALERIDSKNITAKANKFSDFWDLADILDPDVIQMRFNILTAAASEERQKIFDWAEANKVGIVMNKPMAQGLLSGKYDPNNPPVFSDGDHRRKKTWFRKDALSVITRRLIPLKERFGHSTQDLSRVALQYCLAMSPSASVVVGFSSASQLDENLSAMHQPLLTEDIVFIDEVMMGITQEIGSYF